MERRARGGSWAIATPHMPATQAGADAFERGGNAIDAALAAAVTLAASYPHMCGVGGDLFALVQRPDGDAIAINGSGRASAGADLAALAAAPGDRMIERGPATITVPGTVSGWAALHREGARLPWNDAFDRAIDLAENGVPTPSTLARTLVFDDALSADPGIAAIFYPEGKPIAEGAAFKNEALGSSLRLIAEHGPQILYGGELGARYVQGLRTVGCPISIDDLAAHATELLPPLVGRYRDLDVRVVPPNSQGFTLLEILAAIERLGLEPDPLGPDAGAIALVAEAASRDRDRHLADADAMRVHPSTLLDGGHIAAICDEVRASMPSGVGKTQAGRHLGSGDTIALVASDRRGWAVSLIQSLYEHFGSGILEPSTGIAAQNRGACFSTDPRHPNAMAPRKRPAHTLMPVLVHRAGELAAVAGSMGGHAQPQINAMSIIRAFDLGMPPGEVLAAPRWIVPWTEPGDPVRSLIAEGATSAETRTSLARSGFRVQVGDDLDSAVGHAHLIVRDRSGQFDVATDPRADGGALAS